MAAHCDDSDEEESFVVLGTPVPELLEGEALKKPTTLQDLTARDKQGRRRFHGAFTGGFSAGYFNTVGTKEGFTPSTFVSSRQQKYGQAQSHPEDFMDEEDLEEHGIAPRKFTTLGSYTSQERKRKREVDAANVTASSTLDLGSTLANLIIPEQIPIGIKLLQKMGWREGQGLGPRVHKKKKKTEKKSSGVKTYGCALPPSDDSDSDTYTPANMKEVTFAPKDVTPISLEVKDNVHGLGYRGLDPRLALPSSHINLFEAPPVKSGRQGKGIRGQAFGVGAFEDEDEDIYSVDDMSKYDISMQAEGEEDNNFGWTAPRKHGKQTVPVSYVGKLLEGFCLSSKPLQPKKKFSPPELPRHFKPQHWFRKKRATSHIPEFDVGAASADSGTIHHLTAVDRGLMLGETPIMGSVFDLVSKQDKGRIEATKEAIEMTKSLSSTSGNQLKSRFTSETEEKAELSQSSSADLPSSSPNMVCSTWGQSLPSKFKRPEMTSVQAGDAWPAHQAASDEGTKAPLFQGSLHIQPFKRDPAKQERYDRFLALLKQGVTDPYPAVSSTSMTEWEKSRERDEFTKASTMFRPLSAMMSSRFVAKEMIDDDQTSTPVDSETKSDQEKAAEMKMFGKLTREELEWHPDKLLCRRFNVPNPYPDSDIIGLPGAKRDKYSVFNFLNFGDYQPSQNQGPASKPQQVQESGLPAKAPIANRGKKPSMASIFKVLDDPDFHKPTIPQQKTETTKKESEKTEESATEENEEEDGEETPDQDLFRAIFKNSDSESDASEEGKKSDDNESEDDKSGAESEIEVKEIIAAAQEEAQQTSQTEHGGGEVPPQLTDNKDVSAPGTDVKQEMPKTFGSRWGSKSVFSVLDDMTKEEKGTEQGLFRETRPTTVSAEHEEEEDAYGPRLPPSFSSTSHQNAGSPSVFTPHSKERSHSQKSRHEGSHKHKKEKKKKSKHKKDKKHSKKSKRKSSKSHRSHKVSSSGSEADSESDVSDSEIVQRLKTFPGTPRLMGYNK